MKDMPGTEYISKNNSGFIVQKYVNKKMVYYFFSTSLIECLMVRDILIANYWDKECVPPKETVTGEKYIYKDHYGYSVKKYIDGHIEQIGYFTSLEDAIHERDLAMECDWDLETLCNTPVDHEQWLNGKYGKNQFHHPINGRVDIRTW